MADMSERAGIFSDDGNRGLWVWRGNELVDAHGDVIAVVRSDVIFLGQDRLLIESVPGPLHFRARATTGDGRIFTLGQNGMTVGVLNANCDGRRYELKRTSPWRKQRVIVNRAGVAATVRPLISGKVEVQSGPVDNELPLIDAVFLTWGCVLVDSPVRRPRT